MYIKNYKYIKPTLHSENKVMIPELDRLKPSVLQFIKLAKLDLKLSVPTAFIYVEGFSISQAESGITLPDDNKYSVALKSGTGYILHSWIHQIANKELLVSADITASTCASGIQALRIAEEKLSLGICDEVIIIGEERITNATTRLFKELRINIKCGDGFVYLHLTKEKTPLEIKDTKWLYAYNSNPFMFTRETLNNLIPKYPVDNVKLHGTGTVSNEEAEVDLRELANPIKYKPFIGHTQGISSILELCMLIDDNSVEGTTLVVANGLGGFYGACTLWKH